MRNNPWLLKLAMVVLCVAMVLRPGDCSYGDGEFYVIGGGSPWVRNGNNIYYNQGNVGIGITDPGYLFQIFTSSNPVPMRVQTDATGANANAIQAVANYGVAVSGYTVTGKGVLGNAQGGAVGVQGECTGYGAGVYGYNSANGPGVKGVSAASNGVYGVTSSGNTQVDAGVYGKSTVEWGCGVKGEGNYYGVKGVTDGLYGAGVLGEVIGDGVYGVMSRGAFLCTSYAEIYKNLYCQGNLELWGNADILGNLVVHGSTKSAVVSTSKGNKTLYCQESPEVWFEDFGEGRLEGGKARIDLDPLFLETVTIDERNPLKVFIQLNDDCNGVYVQRKPTSFEVKELRSGNSNAYFTYRVVAKRKGFETARLESAKDTTKFADLKTPGRK